MDYLTKVMAGFGLGALLIMSIVTVVNNDHTEQSDRSRPDCTGPGWRWKAEPPGVDT